MPGRIAALALAATLASAATATAAPQLVPIGDFESPTYLAAPPGDGRLFVTEQGGLVKVVRDGVTLPEPFLDLRGSISSGGERGLLSIAFPPDHAASGLVYLYLTAPDGAIEVREHRRSAANPDRADPAGRVVLRVPHPTYGNHNGGTVMFGPDGLLWLATGDGGGTNDSDDNAQDLSSLLGKLLRIDPRPSGSAPHTIPADNPYGTAVWASGLRNPFRFSFDRATGDVAIGDVGQGAREEIDIVSGARARGGNFGWPCFEGAIAGPKPCSPPGYIAPAFDYPRAGAAAVTGGVVVRDPGLPSLAGRYLYSDFYADDIRSLTPAGGDDRSTGLRAQQVAAFGEDSCRRVYVVSLAGRVSRIHDGALSPCPTDAHPDSGSSGSGRADRRAPRLSVRVGGLRLFGRSGRLRLSLGCDEACTISARGRVRGVARLPVARIRLDGVHRRGLRLRLSRRGVRELRRTLRRRRAVLTTVSVVARDAAGNERLRTRRVRVR